MFEYGSLLRLRFLEPDAPRPFSMRLPLVFALPTVRVILHFSLLLTKEKKKVVIGGFVLFFVRDTEIWLISGGVEAAFFILYGIKLLYFKLTKQPIMLIRLSPLLEHEDASN